MHWQEKHKSHIIQIKLLEITTKTVVYKEADKTKTHHMHVRKSTAFIWKNTSRKEPDVWSHPGILNQSWLPHSCKHWEFNLFLSPLLSPSQQELTQTGLRIHSVVLDSLDCSWNLGNAPPSTSSGLILWSKVSKAG